MARGRLLSIGLACVLVVVAAACSMAENTQSISLPSRISPSDPAPPSDAASASVATLPTTAGERLRWVKVDVPSALAAGVAGGTFNAIFGWSHGYIAFHQSMGAGPVVPWTSADGRTWKEGTSMDATGLPYGVSVEDVAEGPAGMVAVGRPPGCADDGSGCMPKPATAIWTSTDGDVWSRLDMQRAFGGGVVGDVSAGPKGYMALGPSTDAMSASPEVWLSSNGTTWQRVDLSGSSFADAFLARGMVLPDGYLIAGRVGTVAGHGSGYYPATTPAIWWSRDGLVWTSVALDGVKAAPEAEAAVTRITDATLAARVVSWDCRGPACVVEGADTTWTSTDGGVWTKAQGRLLPQLTFSDGRRALAIGAVDGVLTVETTTDGIVWTRLPASAGAPADLFDAAFGPSGLLVATTDQSLWLATIESAGS
jgi:hypothetical protein